MLFKPVDKLERKKQVVNQGQPYWKAVYARLVPTYHEKGCNHNHDLVKRMLKELLNYTGRTVDTVIVKLSIMSTMTLLNWKYLVTKKVYRYVKNHWNLMVR